jgi:hypothetical protein
MRVLSADLMRDASGGKIFRPLQIPLVRLLDAAQVARRINPKTILESFEPHEIRPRSAVSVPGRCGIDGLPAGGRA